VRRVLRAAIRALVLAALVAIGFAAVRKQLRDGNDFPLYWQAARDLLAHRSPYDVTSGLHGYVYLPWFALLLAPLAALPLPAAAALWYVANLAFTVVAVNFTLDAVRTALPPPPREGVAVLLAALPLAGLAHDNLVLGQANLLVLLLVAVAARAAIANPGWLAGVPLGCAAALKMPAALLLLPLALRVPRAVLGFALAVAVLLLVPFVPPGAGPGRQLLAEWNAQVLVPAAAGTLQGSKIIDQSPVAALRRWTVAGPAYEGHAVNLRSLSAGAFADIARDVGIAFLLFYVVLWFAAPARRMPEALLLDLALGCCAMVQVTGFNLKAQFVVLFLPALAGTWLALAKRHRSTAILLVLAGLAFLATQSSLTGRALSSLLLAHSAMMLGTLLLTAALVRERLALRRPPSAARTAARAPGTAP